MTIEKNNLDIPDYLDEDFFRNALINKFNDKSIEIKSVDFSMGSSGGENYLSFIYRADIAYQLGSKDGTTKRISLIVKSIPLDGDRAVFVEMDIFNKEKQMYLEIIPKIEDCLKDVKIGPICYYAVSDPIASIVFEDLAASGHKIANRCLGLDEDHCKVVLRKLAQYHAGSILLMDKDSSVKDIEQLQHGIFSSVSLVGATMKMASESNFIKMKEIVPKWPGYEEISKKLENMKSEEFLQRTIDTIRISNDDIVVINHGDIWVNNFMYKYRDDSDDSIPIDVALLDFQGSAFGSLGLDLNYFFATSPQTDVLISKRSSILDAYYAELSKSLENGGYKRIPTKDDIKSEMKKKAFFGFYANLICLPTMAMNKEDSAESSIEKFKDEKYREWAKEVAFSSKRFIDNSKYLLKKFDQIGILD